MKTFCNLTACMHNIDKECGLMTIHLCDGECEEYKPFMENGFKILKLTEKNMAEKLQAITSDKPKYFIQITQTDTPNIFLASDINIIDYETANKIYKKITGGKI